MSSKDGRLPASPSDGDPATKSAVSDETGRGWLPLKYEDGPDFCTVTFATGAAFALTVHPERMKLMEAALSASPVAQEPVAYRYRSSIDPDWIYHDERLPPHDMAWQDEGLEEQGLYRSTPAGLGADEIARAIWETHDGAKRYPWSEMLDCDRQTYFTYATAILALLSRA